MSENKFEAVSSLLDQQAVDTNLLDEVKNDDKLSDAWSRYHLIGDIMRNESGDYINKNLALDISVAIAAEPTLLAPQQNKTVVQRLKAKVIQLSKPAGQFAIAASAAGLMVLGVQQANTPEQVNAIPSQVWQPLPIGGVADPVSYNYTRSSAPTKQQATVERQKRLQAILADHQMQIKLKSATPSTAILTEQQTAEENLN
ncbi:sigma-E factor negative regulatory protein [Colwelliaceae bacterium BS250]